MRWLLVFALFACGESRDEARTRVSTAQLFQATVEKLQSRALRIACEQVELRSQHIQRAIDQATDELAVAQNEADRAAAKTKVDRLQRLHYELEQNLEPKRIDVVVPPPPSMREHHEQRRAL